MVKLESAACREAPPIREFYGGILTWNNDC
jgi:hypothetical protein